ncbi:MAG TPA: hypothetical protein VK484_01275, partial [Ferruginibacter sp.]|nr:hypothetical protein [Ferruginibacter sp.]
MKKGFKLSILFFAGILAITGCKKDEVFKQQTQLTKKQQPITVVEAKKVFLSNFDIDMPFSSEAFIFNPSIKRKNLDWNKAVSFNNDQRFSIIEIPIEFNKGISSLIKKDGLVLSTAKFASQSKLLFLKNRKSGYVYTTIMTVLPEKTEINQNEFHYQSLPLNFTGVVTFSNWDGKLNNSWLYKNGTVTKKITSKGVKINDILPSYANPNGNGQNCEDYIIDTWERDCYYDFNEDYYCTSWALINSQPVTICGSGSGSGGGEYIEHEVDEEDILESFDDRISEDELAGCLSSVFSGVKAIGEGKFATIIQNFSSELPNYNWKVKSAFLPNTSDNAITGHTPISGYFVTTFNMTMLRGASDLS